MKRRNFLKFLGKTIVASGIAVATGLPEIKELETIQSLPSDIWGSGREPEKIVKWNGNTWEKLKSTNLEIRHLVIDKDGTLYAGNKFTLP